MPGNKDSTASLLAQADAALYQAKAAGRDTVHMVALDAAVESGRRLNGQHHAVGNLYQHIVIAHAHQWLSFSGCGRPWLSSS